MKKSLVIGTRGSALALYQARLVQSLLKQAYPNLETTLEIIKTVGDKDRKTALAKVSEKAKVRRGIFIKELEEALEEKRVDIAVHSLKDMPSRLNEGFSLPCFLPRAAREDVIVSKHEGGVEMLPEGATIATGGVRRQCQLKWIRPDLKIVEIRGNVPTRLKKTAENPEIDATMLAAAGLERLEYPVGEKLELETGEPLYLTRLSTAEFLPPGGQGVIAIECREEDLSELAELLAPLHDAQTARECETERAFLEHLGASCDTPVAVMAETLPAGSLKVEARYWKEGEEEPTLAEVEGEDGKSLALELVKKML